MSRIGNKKKVVATKASGKKAATSNATGFMSLDSGAPAPGLDGKRGVSYRSQDAFTIQAILKKSDDFERYYWEITPVNLKTLSGRFVVPGDTIEGVSLDAFWHLPLIRAKVAKEMKKDKQLKRDLAYLEKNPTTIVSVTFVPGRLEDAMFDDDDKKYTGTVFVFNEINGIINTAATKADNRPSAGGEEEDEDDEDDEDALGDEESRH